MKLNIVPARTGIEWVKLGIQTFFKQPLALAGLFFMFMAIMSVATLIPFIGGALALAFLPAATLGLMAATQEATKGKFPMPSILITAFRAGRQELRSMLVLGALYAAGFLLVMGISALFDGGQFARMYLLGDRVSGDMILSSDFQLAMWVAMGLYLPLSLLFWHAPALVHWYGVPPAKSLFFSIVACFRNFGAFTVFGLVWATVFLAVGLVFALLAALLGSPELVSIAMMPIALLMATMFFTSIYFTFRDSFATTEPETA
ncbi:MAG: BPSS1780 family membrane protein [Rhodoferax sp.]|nr:BPSS1780 family membrane protein [Rhodoferax sp.]